jgi:hypothetical protein
VTDVPIGPLVGLNDEIVGAAACAAGAPKINNPRAAIDTAENRPTLLIRMLDLRRKRLGCLQHHLAAIVKSLTIPRPAAAEAPSI